MNLHISNYSCDGISLGISDIVSSPFRWIHIFTFSKKHQDVGRADSVCTSSTHTKIAVPLNSSLGLYTDTSTFLCKVILSVSLCTTQVHSLFIQWGCESMP